MVVSRCETNRSCGAPRPIPGTGSGMAAMQNFGIMRPSGEPAAMLTHDQTEDGAGSSAAKAA